MAGRKLASFLLVGLARAHTPWDLIMPCSVAPTCPYIKPTRDKRSQMGEDLFVRKEFFCDVCPPAHLVHPVPPSGSLEAGQRSYVEIGALDGLKYSNTFLLEHALGFGGVLIEGHPINAKKLARYRGAGGLFQWGQRGRNHIVREAVCSGRGTLTYTGLPGLGTAGGIEQMAPGYKAAWKSRFKHNFTVPCRPIGEMIRGAGLKHVDFFSLDVEGAELIVLQTFDWSVTVGVWVIEADGHSRHKDAAVKALLLEHGYGLYAKRGMNEVYLPQASIVLAASRIAHCQRCIEAALPDPMYEKKAIADFETIQALAAKPTTSKGRSKTATEKRQRITQKTDQKSSLFSRFRVMFG